MQSIENKIEINIKKSKRGKIFFQDDFATLGTPGAIRLALSRIEKKRLLFRVAKQCSFFFFVPLAERAVYTLFFNNLTIITSTNN